MEWSFNWTLHNVTRRRSESDGDSFNLGENLLDMNEETMELAMEEVEDMDTLKEATQKEEAVDIKEEERGGHVKAAEVVSRREPDDNSFDLGENVLDMNEETMELAMEEEETIRKEGLVDVKEHPVQAKVYRIRFNQR